MLVRLVRLVAGRRWSIAVGALLGFAAIGSNIALLATAAYLISKAALVTNVAEVALAITAVRVLAISRAVFRYLERYVTHAATLRILADLRVWFYASIEPIAPARLTSHRSGDLLTRVVADVETLERFYVQVLVPPITAALVVAAASVWLGTFDVLLGVVLLAFLVLTGIVVPILVQRLSRDPAVAFIERRAELSALIVDEVQGLADLIALDAAGRHRASALATGRALERQAERLAALRGISAGLAALLTSLCGVVILAVAISLVDRGALDGVYLALLPLAAVAAFEAVEPLSLSLQLLHTSDAAGRRLFALTDVAPTVIDPIVPEPLPAAFGLEVRDLRFAYDATSGPILDDVSFTIPDGQSLALVGPSGSGKTTLVNLLLRFWESDRGSIRIGGRDVHDLRADDVRRMLGVVSQHVHLFDATIRDNLAVADADVTDERVELACRQAQLHDFIMTLPLGYETRIGEDGVRLSGGERRRLAIARAIIKDAPVLVLDEPTADIDVSTEERLLVSLESFMRGRTTLLISHREAVIRHADTVLVLDAGRMSSALA